MPRFRSMLVPALAAALLLIGALELSAQTLAAHQQLARDVYKQLIEINTSDSVGDNTAAAEAMAARFRAAGFPAADVFVGGPAPRKGNLVVRYRGRPGTSQKPILLLAHLDVVEAKKEDWSPDLDPFKFIEKDGYFYGRGTADDKAMAAIFVANLLRMKQQNLVPERDIILALTADEEGGDHNGVEWLIANHRALVDAEFGLNEGGGGQAKAGRRIANRVQASEKIYADFTLEITNKGGHSSQPQPENAIYEIAEALARIGKFTFPAQLNEVTRAYFEKMAGIETGPLAADFKAIARPTPDAAAVARLSAAPLYNAMLRTTCVATMVNGGHALNALPQRATANVNCRILPGEDPQAVLKTLTQAVNDPKIAITPVKPAKPSPPSPLTPAIMSVLTRVTEEMWPGVPVVPFMSTGATDGLYFRQIGVPIYGVSGLFGDMDDVRAHGRDERMGVKEFFDGQEFLWWVVTALSGTRPR
ncbi:MAG TPA: M20/M25/M40 family metallo-hydrolase [Vicinamibacterales bacterium]|nr:M20/M25/M40 family metallo-hydrolase [Vicinamibacterales bacterium]